MENSLKFVSVVTHLNGESEDFADTIIITVCHYLCEMYVLYSGIHTFKTISFRC